MVVDAVMMLDDLLPLNMIGMKKVNGGALEVSTRLFNCTHIPTHLTPTDLWKNPVKAAALLEVWALRLADL